MTVQIHTAQSSEQCADVFRMRYEVYVEELGRTQAYADHQARTIHEPLDDLATLWVAYDGPSLVGTVRVNYASHGGTGDYASLYQMARAGSEHPARTSITTKLIVAPAYRNSSLAYRLATAGYRRMLRDGIMCDFIDVYPPRLPFFERLGYQIHVPEVQHAEYGSVVVMRLNLRDSFHLKQVNSPFFRHLVRETALACEHHIL